MNDTLAPWERELLESATPTKVVAWFNITAQMVVLSLLDILDRFGEDHIARNPSGDADAAVCIYAVKNTSNALVPVCIVGQFLADLGLLGLALRQPGNPHDGVLCANPNNVGGMFELRDYLRDRGVTMDENAYRILSEAQAKQDSGNTWGDSVNNALRVADSMHGLPFLREPSHLDRAKAWQESI